MPLRVGTDCSGIEAPIIALRQMKIPFIHSFSSEIDVHCIKMIRANFSPNILYGDIRHRSLQGLPDVDLYVCGFPCQPFSSAGKRNGSTDPRGQIFWECLRVIRSKKPRWFLLENVPGMLSLRDDFQTLVQELESLNAYEIHWKILNTADYGIPQSRKRLYIIGLLRKHIQQPFQWPQPVPCPPVSHLVDWRDRTPHPKITTRMKTIIHNAPPDAVFLNLSFSKDPNKKTPYVSPTLTSAGNMWCVPLRRFANPTECLRLQGFPSTFKIVVSPRQIKKQLGNTMSVNVIIALFTSMFRASPMSFR